MGVFGWLLARIDRAILGKEHIAAVRKLYQGIVDHVDEHEHVVLLDHVLGRLASKEIEADAAIATVRLLLPDYEYGGEINALAESLAAEGNSDWRETVLSLCRIRGHVAAAIVDAYVAHEIERVLTDEMKERLVRARDGLGAKYRQGEPRKIERQALDREAT
jgi:hypothetical protein